MQHTQPPRGSLYLHPVALAFVLLMFAAATVFFWWILKPEETEQKTEPQRIVLNGARPTPGGEPEATTIPTPRPRSRSKVEGGKPPLPDASDVVLSGVNRSEPGEEPTEWLYVRAPGAESVRIGGSWDGWDAKTPMVGLTPGLWAFHIGALDAPFGMYQFKFIVDGEWEGGANRILHLNPDGLMEKPPEAVSRTLIESPHSIRIVLQTVPENRGDVDVRLEPSHGPIDLRWRVPETNPRLAGYRLVGEEVEFIFDPIAYGLDPAAVKNVVVAGTFNQWNAADGRYLLKPTDGDELTLRLPYSRVNRDTEGEHLMFKFVVDGEWRDPPPAAPNAMLEPGTTHRNLSIPKAGVGGPELWVQTDRPIDLSHPPVLTVTGLHETALTLRPTPGDILDTLYSPKPMGVTLDRKRNKTIYRLFAPRATAVHLGFFDGPYHTTPVGDPVDPTERLEMTRDDKGVWEHTRDGLDIGQYYAYQVAGPAGDGEGFAPDAWIGDPYAKAVSLAEGNSLVVDLEAQKATPRSTPRIPWEDMVIYETHVRHFTQDESSGVSDELRGNYLGMLATKGEGTGLDHLKELGVNVVQLMPIHEFNNGFGDKHDWGYASCFFFAPESSYAQEPLKGSQVEEMKQLVEGLHEEGFAVFLDVVYNHIGGFNVFDRIDRKYYFRLNPDLTNCNFSGCGNDVATERPMMRRLIKESVLYWVEEYGVDGFRFDLGELIDDRTLLEIEREIRRKHPHVVLHSEPWSFRGHHKDFLSQTSWGGWNDQFREPAKRFVTGRGDKESLKKAIRGSVESWTTRPLQSVNYMESHDDYALVDELSDNPGGDGRELSPRDERIHKLAATVIFSSLGTPMITEGQAFLRSKHGVRNTYNRGDALNALRWDERDRPHAREVLDYYSNMIAFRLGRAGRALRVADAPSLDYTRFIDPGVDTALGWILNANDERPGVPAVMVLMNAGTEPAEFTVDFPTGNWRHIGDGDQVVPEGLDGVPTLPGGETRALTVPPQTAWIYRSGF